VGSEVKDENEKLSLSLNINLKNQNQELVWMCITLGVIIVLEAILIYMLI